jgi:hypothetical protein
MSVFKVIRDYVYDVEYMRVKHMKEQAIGDGVSFNTSVDTEACQHSEETYVLITLLHSSPP